MKKLVISLFIFLILLGVGISLYSKFFTKPLKVVHYHAGFLVYKDNKLVDFKKPEYMHEKPCKLHPDPNEQVDEQIEKAHLHDFVSDVVHVHREPVYWRDLFTNLKYSIPHDAEGYLNGKKVSDILNTQIHPYDTIIILIGKHGDIKQYLTHQVSKVYIQEKEKGSEQCGT